NGTVLVSGPQSLLTVDDTLEVIANGPAVLTVTADSSAFFRVRGQYPAFFMGPSSRLEVSHAATALLDFGGQFWSSELALDEGNVLINSGLLRIINDSSVRGTGTIQGPILLTSLA